MELLETVISYATPGFLMHNVFDAVTEYIYSEHEKYQKEDFKRTFFEPLRNILKEYNCFCFDTPGCNNRSETFREICTMAQQKEGSYFLKNLYDTFTEALKHRDSLSTDDDALNLLTFSVDEKYMMYIVKAIRNQAQGSEILYCALKNILLATVPYIKEENRIYILRKLVFISYENSHSLFYYLAPIKSHEDEVLLKKFIEEVLSQSYVAKRRKDIDSAFNEPRCDKKIVIIWNSNLTEYNKKCKQLIKWLESDGNIHKIYRQLNQGEVPIEMEIKEGKVVLKGYNQNKEESDLILIPKSYESSDLLLSNPYVKGKGEIQQIQYSRNSFENQVYII